MRLFYSFFDSSALNSIIVLKKNVGLPKMNRMLFLKDLTKSLCKGYAQSEPTIKIIPKDIKKRIHDVMNLEIQDSRPALADDVTAVRCNSMIGKKIVHL